MKEKQMFEIENRPVIKFGGVDFPSVEAAKVYAMKTFDGVDENAAKAIVAQANEVAAILLWQPDAKPTKPKSTDGAPGVTDQQIHDACEGTGVPYLVAKVRIRRQGWTLGKATTTPVRKRTKPEEKA